MTVPTHIRVQFVGSLLNTTNPLTGTEETWTFGLHYNGEHGLGAGDKHAEDVDTAACANAWLQLFASSFFTNGVNLREVKVYDIGTDGHMVGNPKIDILSAGTEPRGTSGTKWPPQCALVVTTVGAERGPARYGRFYLPGFIGPLDTDFRISAANQTQLLDASVAFVKAISDAVGAPALMSADMLNISSRAGGVKQSVDHIRVGRVVDTHRSRRRSLVEDYRDSGHIDW